ncbi:MAG: hypothetical protein AAB433_09880 [Nitrospirota bacterium]
MFKRDERDRREERDGWPGSCVALFPLVSPLSLNMADNNALYAVRFPDGSVSLYIDEDYAIERGVDPATLTRVEIPRDLFVSGTIQEIREYVAVYLESHQSGTA